MEPCKPFCKCLFIPPPCHLPGGSGTLRVVLGACRVWVGEEDAEVGSALGQTVMHWGFLVSFQEQQPSWTDDLPLCHLSGVGSASNRSYSADGKGTESHPPEDNWLKFR